MTRNAMPQFDSFDPEVMEAARDVAARAGVPLETWIASVVPQPGVQANRRQRRRQRAEQAALGEPRSEVAREREPDPIRSSPGSRRYAPASEPLDRGLAAVMDRLDGLDRAMDEERWAAQEAENRRLTEIEARIERALKGGPAQQVSERLGEIERRVSQLGEQFAASRPPGRRGRPAAAEIRDAVHDIRQRQRELSQDRFASSEDSVVASMRADLARRLDARIDGPGAPSAAVSEFQREAARLREAIDGLATSRDVGTLEQAVVSLATGVERAEAGIDLTVIAAPIERVRVQVERLADAVGGDVHARVTDDVRRLAGRLDGLAESGALGADRQALKALFAELDEIRHLVGTLAGPERIQSLVHGLDAVSQQIARLQDAGGLASGLRPLLEEIRTDVRTAAPAVLAEQIQVLAGKVDALSARADRIDRAGPAAALPAGNPEALGSIHAMLSSLAEKVERVGSRPESEGFDALERQVLSLADRIDAPRGDPAFAGLERTMGDLLQQVTALRETAPSEEVVERLAREAVADTLKGSGLPASDPGEIGLLRASLADMQARQVLSDQRLGATLDGVQSALDRLVSRLGPAEQAAPRIGAPGERTPSTAGAEAALAPGARRPAGARDPSFDLSRIADGLLEPGAGRPVREARGEAPRRPARDRSREPGADQGRDAASGRDLPEAGQDGDIKTSFIAAARRAAQAAQAELAAEEPVATRREPRDRLGVPAASGESRLGRLRAEIDRRRRPLLLGLAAIVLALGALQAISMRSADEAPRPAPIVQPAAPKDEAPRGEGARMEAPKADTNKAETSKGEAAKPALGEAGREDPKPVIPDPVTTQSIPTPRGPQAAAKSAVPQVSGMNTLTADLGNLPAGLAKTKLAALDGDGAAIWDIASREADGRGMPRDLSLAAKLYEKLATAGYAPAQYKLAGQYEKGAGLVRDLDKAKLWYGRAAEQGHARSMHNLAVIYAENPAANGKPDFASAASWFRQGAEYGVRDSQYNLAVLYARGLGLSQDLLQSYAWFAAAAGQGDEEAVKKRDDVATKLAPADLASAKNLAAAFKPRKLDVAVNEPPAVRETVTAPMSLLGAPSPNANAFTPPARKTL